MGKHVFTKQWEIKVKGKPVDISINIYRIVDHMAKERGYFMDVSIVMRDKVFCLSTTVDYSVVNVVSSIVV